MEKFGILIMIIIYLAYLSIFEAFIFSWNLKSSKLTKLESAAAPSGGRFAFTDLLYDVM